MVNTCHGTFIAIFLSEEVYILLEIADTKCAIFVIDKHVHLFCVKLTTKKGGMPIKDEQKIQFLNENKSSSRWVFKAQYTEWVSEKVGE